MDTNMDKTLDVTIVPSVGDRVVWNVHGEKIRATVTGIFPRRTGYLSVRHPNVELSPGSVRIAQENGTAYSFHPQVWMTHILSGDISLER